MPVSLNSQVGSSEHMSSQLMNATLSAVRVATPGIIQSFDPESCTCTVQPAIMGKSDDGQGNVRSKPLPLLVDVPVIFPRGGGCTLTFPVKAGDECLLIFADRCIDFWWQSGGVQEPVDTRMHDLSDAFAIPGPMSQTRKISGISTSAAQLRTDDGAAFVEVAAGHAITLQTPGRLTATATGGAEITAPEIVLNGNVTINGNLSQGMGAGGGAAIMRGPVSVTNDVTAGGKSLVSHTHSGVETGPGNTGAPN